MHERQPGDLILDTYLPTASAEERALARENLVRLARLLFSVYANADAGNPQAATREKSGNAVDSTAVSLL